MAERETVVGRLGQEPLTKSTSKGEVVEFTLARTDRLLGPDGRWVDGATTWYRVSAWDRLGRNVARSLHKGQPAIVHGTVFTHSWTGQDGDQRSELRIRATAIGHDLNTGTAAFARSEGSAAMSTTTVQPSVQSTPAPAGRSTPQPTPAPSQPAWSTPLVPAPAAQEGWVTAAAAEADAPF